MQQMASPKPSYATYFSASLFSLPKNILLALHLNFPNFKLNLLLLVSFIMDTKMSLFHISSQLFGNWNDVSFHLLFCRQNPSELYTIICTSLATNHSYSVFLNTFNIFFKCCVKPHKKGMEQQTEEAGKVYSNLKPTI